MKNNAEDFDAGIAARFTAILNSKGDIGPLIAQLQQHLSDASGAQAASQSAAASALALNHSKCVALQRQMNETEGLLAIESIGKADSIKKLKEVEHMLATEASSKIDAEARASAALITIAQIEAKIAVLSGQAMEDAAASNRKIAQLEREMAALDEGVLRSRLKEVESALAAEAAGRVDAEARADAASNARQLAECELSLLVESSSKAKADVDASFSRLQSDFVAVSKELSASQASFSDLSASSKEKQAALETRLKIVEEMLAVEVAGKAEAVTSISSIAMARDKAEAALSSSVAAACKAKAEVDAQKTQLQRDLAAAEEALAASKGSAAAALVAHEQEIATLQSQMMEVEGLLA